MATAAKTTPQDLPPKGGYAAFNTERVKLRSLMSGRTAILGYLAVTAGGYYIYYQNFKFMKKHEVEMRSAKLAMMPMLLAERDRTFLKQLRKNRNDEAELMKDVPGWVVGTLFGTPVYKTHSDEIFTEPTVEEYYVHASDKDLRLRNEIRLWS